MTDTALLDWLASRPWVEAGAWGWHPVHDKVTLREQIVRAIRAGEVAK